VIPTAKPADEARTAHRLLGAADGSSPIISLGAPIRVDLCAHVAWICRTRRAGEARAIQIWAWILELR
jgi:hypothetical protein